LVELPEGKEVSALLMEKIGKEGNLEGEVLLHPGKELEEFICESNQGGSAAGPMGVQKVKDLLFFHLSVEGELVELFPGKRGLEASAPGHHPRNAVAQVIRPLIAKNLKGIAGAHPAIKTRGPILTHHAPGEGRQKASGRGAETHAKNVGFHHLAFDRRTRAIG
jgi:hypothetical protein